MTNIPELVAHRIYIELAANQSKAIRKMNTVFGHALVRTHEFDDILTELPVWRILLHSYAN